MLAIIGLMLQAAAPAALPPGLVAPATIASPGPEALAQGRRLAETGMLASLLPLLAAKETEEIVAAHPGLTPDEQAALRRTAAATLDAKRNELFAAEARAFAERLTLDELNALVAFNTGPAAARYRAVQPAAIVAAMGVLDGFDFKKASWAAYCTKAAKPC